MAGVNPYKIKVCILLFGHHRAMRSPELLLTYYLCRQAAMQSIVKNEVFDCIMAVETHFRMLVTGM